MYYYISFYYFSTDVIKKLHSENYKFCLGCAYFDDANQCHSVEVCDRDAVGIMYTLDLSSVTDKDREIPNRG